MRLLQVDRSSCFGGQSFLGTRQTSGPVFSFLLPLHQFDCSSCIGGWWSPVVSCQRPEIGDSGLCFFSDCYFFNSIVRVVLANDGGEEVIHFLTCDRSPICFLSTATASIISIRRFGWFGGWWRSVISCYKIGIIESGVCFPHPFQLSLLQFDRCSCFSGCWRCVSTRDRNPVHVFLSDCGCFNSIVRIISTDDASSSPLATRLELCLCLTFRGNPCD
jgi:hypothetical protein